MPSVGDIVFCRIIPPNGSSYWVAKEVSAVDGGCTITHVCAVGIPDSQSKISLFAEYKTPRGQGDLVKEFAQEVQAKHSGRIDKEYPDINLLFRVFGCR